MWGPRPMMFTALARTWRPSGECRRAAGGWCAHRAAAAGISRTAAGYGRYRADRRLSPCARPSSSGDRPTVAFRVANHATRIGADLTVAMDLDGQVIARGEAPGAVDPTLLAALKPGAGDESGEARFVVTPSGAARAECSFPVLTRTRSGESRWIARSTRPLPGTA